MSQQELLREVWGYAPSVRSRAPAHVIARLRAKLDEAGSRIVTIRGRGYRLDVSPDPALVGRAAELVQVAEAVARHRIATIHGPGGVGKSRLARVYARRADNPLWVGVSGLGSVRAVLTACGERLGVPVSGDVVAAIGQALGDRASSLLVIDGAESVIEELTPILRRWLDDASELSVLVTSRVVVDLEGRVALGPLPADDAAELFEQRAKAVDQQIDLGDDIAAIVERLDHLPLAIELAAGQLLVLDPDLLRDRLLRDPLSVLHGPRRSLTDTFEASWQLLSPRERDVLGFVAQFPSSCPRDALTTTFGPEVDNELAVLARSSLCQLRDQRWSVLDLTREFVLPRATPQVAAAFVSWCAAAVLPRWHALEGHGERWPTIAEDQASWERALNLAVEPATRGWLAVGVGLAALKTHLDRSLLPLLRSVDLDACEPVCAALVRLLETGFTYLTGHMADAQPPIDDALRRARDLGASDEAPRPAHQAAITVVLPQVWTTWLFVRSHLQPSGDWIDEALRFSQWLDEHDVAPRILAFARARVVEALRVRGRFTEAFEVARRAWYDDPPAPGFGRLATLNMLLRFYLDSGQIRSFWPELRAAWEEIRHEPQKTPYRVGYDVAHALYVMGRPEQAEEVLVEVEAGARANGNEHYLFVVAEARARMEPDPERARSKWQHVREWAREMGVAGSVALATCALAELAHHRGDLAAARAGYEESLADATADPPALATLGLALVHHELGRPDEAATVLAGLDLRTPLERRLAALVEGELQDRFDDVRSELDPGFFHIEEQALVALVEHRRSAS